MVSDALPPKAYTVVEDALVSTLLRYSGTPFEDVNERNLISISHRALDSYCKRDFVLVHHLKAEELQKCEDIQPTC